MNERYGVWARSPQPVALWPSCGMPAGTEAFRFGLPGPAADTVDRPRRQTHASLAAWRAVPLPLRLAAAAGGAAALLALAVRCMLLTATDGMGYGAAALVLATFCARTMVVLRALAIASNGAFIAYGSTAHLWPIVVLHAVMLPLNLARLREALGCAPAPGAGRPA